MNDVPTVGDRPPGDDVPVSGGWDTTARVARLLEVVQRFATLDFSEVAPIGMTGDDLDALAAGINMLGEELEGWNNDFTERVDQRTAQLTAAAERLEAEVTERRRAEELLREVNERKDGILAMVAHDLRNPLGTISGFSQTLQHQLRATLGQQDALLLRRIDAQAQRMLHLVNDLLDAAVLERVTFELELEDVDLHGLLGDIIATQAAAAARKDIRIELDEPGGPVTATVDRYRIAQVFDNLLSNATKFTQPGTGATITVSCSQDGTAVRIRVDDQGIGIDADLMPRLFEPFARLSATGTDGEPSTGLGLAITRSIVSSHGGTIEVSSEPGRGSSFEVVLPISAQHAAEHVQG